MFLPLTENFTRIIKENAPMTLVEIIAEEIRQFRGSAEYARMEEGIRYYNAVPDVLTKTNDEKTYSNVKMVHPILRKLVRQKVNFLLAKPFTVVTDSEEYTAALDDFFDIKRRQAIKRCATDAVMCGRGFIAPYFDADGELLLRALSPTEVIPLFEDAAEEKLTGYIRVYPQTLYEGRNRLEVTKVELWTADGVLRFSDSGKGTTLRCEDDVPSPHFLVNGKAYNFREVPLVCVKYNDEALPLIAFVKSIIDEIDWQNSLTADVLRDVANFIYVLKNYGGQDLAEFMSDIKKHRVIKTDGDGGVDKLSADINIDAVMKFLDNTRRDLYDLAFCVDTKDPDLGNASGTAIGFRYMDLTSDCEEYGTSVKQAIISLKPFIDCGLSLCGKGQFDGVDFDIIFNTDMPVNEADVINNIKASEGILSKRTLIENHPWVINAENELARLEEDEKEAMEKFESGIMASVGDGGAQRAQNGVNDDE